MAYEPTNWETGDDITSEKLNKIEQGIENEQVGPQGEQGPKGDPGEDGTDGAKGDQGDPGTAGEDGFGTEEQYNDIISRLEALEGSE